MFFSARHSMYTIDIPEAKVCECTEVKLQVLATRRECGMMQVNMIGMHAASAGSYEAYKRAIAGDSSGTGAPFEGYGLPVAGDRVTIRWVQEDGDGSAGDSRKLRVVVVPMLEPDAIKAHVTGRFQGELEQQATDLRQATSRIQREGIRSDLMHVFEGGRAGGSAGNGGASEHTLVRTAYRELFEFL